MKFPGLIIGRNEDPGDSCHRTCMWFLGQYWFRNKIINGMGIMFSQLECRNKAHHYRRHPSPGWWSECNRLSRDQATPLVIAFVVFKYRYRLKKFLLYHFFRLGFFTNTRRNGATPTNHGLYKYGPNTPGNERHNYNWKLPDFITPEFIGIYIRGFKFYPLYPFLLLADLYTLLSSILWRFKKEDDILNHTIVCEFITRYSPTPLALLAKKINSKRETNLKMFNYFRRVGLLEMAQLWEYK